jgi:head-tail adaptor
MRVDESKTFNPGRARHKLTIWRPSKSKDSFGSDVVTLVLVATVRAQVLPLQGREFDAIQQRFANARYKILMQFTPGIEREYSIQWLREDGTLTLDILDVQDMAGVGNCTVILAGDANAR